MVEEVLLHIARIGAEAAPRIASEFRRGAIAASSHGEQNTVNPCVDGHGIQPFISKEQDAVSHLYPYAWKSHKRFAKGVGSLF